MAVKAVILDLDGTLVSSDGTSIAGVRDMMDDLRGANLAIAVASNRLGAARKLERAGLVADVLLTRRSVGISKGSPQWAAKAAEEFGVETNELLWLGDSDPDMWSAVNAQVVYFNAGWSMPTYPYGINVQKPALFSTIVRECFMKEVYWYWQLSTSDRTGRQVTATAMVDGYGAGIPDLKNDLLSFLKYGGNPRVGAFRVRDLMMLHLIGSIYGDGMYRRADTWTVYPGSRGGPNKALGPFIEVAARLFRDRYAEDLLRRHTRSIDSGKARKQGIQVDFLNQANTVCVNEAHRSRIEGRCVLVVDDFATRGYSSECARNLLLEAGATEVISVSIGKYGLRQHVVTQRIGHSWNPYAAVRHSPDDFRDDEKQGTADDDGLTVVRESYQRLAS